MQLTPELLLLGYARGIFPMADHNGQIEWYEPNPRTIIPLDGLHVSRRLGRTVRQGTFEIRYDSDFRGTMEACANRESTWINEEILRVYIDLHLYGFAHSVECWQDGQMVGGLYGVALKGLFAGESMFSVARDASKVALVYLVERLRAGGYTLLDVQFTTEHLLSLGAVEIPRVEYLRRLAQALKVDARWDSG
jgi:leucyl/phenylalanyl-tRNA--protein transferase